MTISFTAYHGTFPSRANSISELGVQPSVDGDHWLGDGAYFFIEGLGDPKASAIEWATCAAWDKTSPNFTGETVALVEVRVTAPSERVFDLRDTENAREFHAHRRMWLRTEMATKPAHLSRPVERTYDGRLFNQFKAEQGLAVLIGNFYIQLSVPERYFRLDSRIPNVSVLCLTPDQDQSTMARVTDIAMVERPVDMPQDPT